MITDESMRVDVRKALINLYGIDIVQHWNINETVANLLLEYLVQEGECNNLMGWVPRPWTVGRQPLKQVSKHIAKQIFKSAADKTPGCMNQSKNNFRRRFYDAGMGY